MQKEEERLKAVVKNKKSIENRIKNFKRFMGYFLEASGRKKVTTDNHIYTLYHYKDIVDVAPGAELPDEYISETTYTRLLPNNQARVK